MSDGYCAGHRHFHRGTCRFCTMESNLDAALEQEQPSVPTVRGCEGCGHEFVAYGTNRTCDACHHLDARSDDPRAEYFR